jgi:hypothetical protein
MLRNREELAEALTAMNVHSQKDTKMRPDLIGGDTILELL